MREKIRPIYDIGIDQDTTDIWESKGRNGSCQPGLAIRKLPVIQGDIQSGSADCHHQRVAHSS